MSTLFIDIETRRTNNLELIARLQAQVKPPGNYKKPETIMQWWADEGNALKARAADATALDGTYGSVASIACALDDGPVVCVYGDDEPRILASINDVFRCYPDTVVAFNGEFDIRFIYQRMVINGMSAPRALIRALHDKAYLYDPMKEWSGWKGFIKQRDLEIALGISRDEDVTGQEIGALIDISAWDQVERHNIADVENLRTIYRRMTA
jgi:3'-5' exonuclease